MIAIKVTLKMPTEVCLFKSEIAPGRTSVWSAEFFTIGYSGRLPTDFVDALKRGCTHLIDVRFTPVSQFRPQFSKENLRRLLAEDVDYLHRPELGVPRDVRGLAVGLDGRATEWEWYDDYVINRYLGQNLSNFFNAAVHPIAFMCVEADPHLCHRHRLALALERVGLHCHDL